MSRSVFDKALAAIGEERVRVVKASPQGIALTVIAAKPDPATLVRRQYRTLVYMYDGACVRECTCPALKRCYHVAAAELIWRPADTDVVSAR